MTFMYRLFCASEQNTRIVVPPGGVADATSPDGVVIWPICVTDLALPPVKLRLGVVCFSFGMDADASLG